MAHPLRRRFRIELLAGLSVVWPVLSVLLLLMAALGVAVAMIEGWSLTEGLYFAFVTGMTIAANVNVATSDCWTAPSLSIRV